VNDIYTARTAYLSLGSNLGERRENLRAAIRMLEDRASCIITVVSSLYETKPVGLVEQPDFLNAVIAVKTTLSPADLLERCMKTEETLGRQRTIRWGPRVIDIDILLYEDVSMETENLIIPHPRMAERAFVLIPLAEIAPDVQIGDGMTAFEAAGRISSDGVVRVQDESWSKI